MKPLLATLDPSTIDILISWCESEPNYPAISARAAKPLSDGGLNLRISPSSLNRLYTTHNIADSKETRAQYAVSLGIAAKKIRLLNATRENLEQRLFEITSRPDPTTADLRLTAQFIHRADSIAISKRRVQVAEHREARVTKLSEPPKPLAPEESKRKIHHLMGKDFRALVADFEAKAAAKAQETPLPSSSQSPTKSEISPSPQSQSSQPAQSEISNFKSEIPSPPSASVLSVVNCSDPQTLQSLAHSPASQFAIVNMQLPITNPSAPQITKSSPPSASVSSVPSVVKINPPTLHVAREIRGDIPAPILAHAERSYPSHLRPNCPILGPQWDWAKDHCIQSRLKFAREAAEKLHKNLEPPLAATTIPAPQP
jgi:hypothetical protein